MNGEQLLIGVVIVLVGIPVLGAVILNITEERRKIKYYKMELERSGSEERRFWQRKIRRAYLKQIPVIRLFLKK